ncbi:uncharacterized protein LOC141655365 [Silene latifolia]|uniref:uncharacterized protein LOC141655365 n=1 Tax=Silene latifolia TaxID=37657 RepID=UPI003D78A33A
MGISMIKKGETIGDLTIEPELYAEIREKQEGDALVARWRDTVIDAVAEGVRKRFHVGNDGSLRFDERWCVPDDEELKRKILTEAHSTRYFVHPGGEKLYKDLKKTFWWPKIKKEVAKFVARCLVCQRVKGEHKRPPSIGMAPFEALYGRKCKSPVCWDDRAYAVVLGPEMIQEMVEQVHIIRQKMRAAQDRQKSYADLKRIDIEFAMGDKVLLKVSPMRGVMRFWKKGNLSQKYIGPYEILDRVGEVAYRLALPPALDRVHNIFHVSQLRKYVSDPTHVLEPEHIEIDEQLSYVEEPKEILDRKVRKTRNGDTTLVKVLWSNHKVDDATWEAEAAMRDKYPSLFV